MNKSIVSLVLLFFYLLIINEGNAQEALDTTIKIPAVSLTESRLEISYKESARHIDRITQEFIKNSNARSVAELLQLNAGIDIRRRGPHGVQSDVGIRGSSFAQVLVMVNGVKMIDPQTAHHVMNLPIDLEAIERIEIIKGPAARKFGQNAFAGAINIVTKSADNNFAKISLRVAENSTQELGISGAFKGNTISHYISASQAKSDGYRYNTDYKIGRIYYQAKYKVSEQNSINLQSGITQRKFGANGFYASPEFIDQYEEVTTGFVSLSSDIIKNNMVIKPVLYYRENHDDYVFLRQNPSFFNNVHTGNTLGAELNIHHLNRFGNTSWGVMASKETLSSNNLGQRDRTILGFNIEHQLSLLNDRFKVSPGFYVNKFSDRDANIFPGIDISYSFNSAYQLFSNISTASRIPTYTNLYYSSPSELGNAELSDETINQLELGFKYNSKVLKLTSSVFTSSSDNIIDWVRNQDQIDILWSATNISSLNQTGLDLSMQLDLSNQFFSHNAFGKIGYTFIDSELDFQNENEISRYSFENLRHQVVFNLVYTITNYISHSISYRYADRENLASFNVYDSKISLDLGNLNLNFQVDNIFDTSYRETNLVVMPGRWIGVGASYRIE